MNDFQAITRTIMHVTIGNAWWLRNDASWQEKTKAISDEIREEIEEQFRRFRTTTTQTIDVRSASMDLSKGPELFAETSYLVDGHVKFVVVVAPQKSNCAFYTTDKALIELPPGHYLAFACEGGRPSWVQVTAETVSPIHLYLTGRTDPVAQFLRERIPLSR